MQLFPQAFPGRVAPFLISVAIGKNTVKIRKKNSWKRFSQDAANSFPIRTQET